MKVAYSWYLFALAVVFVLFEGGSCYQCYSCVEVTAKLRPGHMPPLPLGLPITKSCIDGSDLSSVGKFECAEPNSSCLFYVVPIIDNVKLYNRACDNPAVCTWLPLGSKCSSCDTNLCNSDGFVKASSAPYDVVPLVLECISLVFAIILYR